MNYRLEYTERAAAEIDGAMQWWATERSVAQAMRWYMGIRRAIRDLTDEPQRFPLALESKLLGRSLRQLDYGVGSRPAHRVLFEIVGDVVRVLSVRHGAQDAVRADELD